jgi:2-C-methyl-D-erythritol 4-phosphate cytidylyltransferase
MSNERTDFAVVLPAAGSGKRFNAGAGPVGGADDKLMMDICGRSVLQRAVGLFARRSDVMRVVIVTGPERFAAYQEHLREIIEPRRLAFVPGGRERWESVLFGLRYLSGLGAATPPFVAVHDAARPLTPDGVIEESFHVAAQRGAALPCVPEPATLKRRGEDGAVSETVSRANLFQAQTPQCFDCAKLLAGYEKLLKEARLADVTDDAQVFERMGLAVPITAGSPLNLKITTPEDLALARALAGE